MRTGRSALAVAVAVAVVAAATLTLAACGGDDSKSTSRLVDKASGGKVKVDRDGQKVTVKDKNGSATIESGGEMPAVLKDFPVPKGVKVISSITGSSDSGKGSYVQLGADGDAKRIAADYEKQLGDAGYEVTGKYTAEMNGASTTTFSFKKGSLDGGIVISADKSNSDYPVVIAISVNSA
jgi:hypothetical protein